MKNLAILGGKPVGQFKMPGWPIFDQNDIDVLAEVVKSGHWGFLGPKEKEFEKKFAEFCGVDHAIASTNGTHTLRMALEVLGVGPGDEVIVPGLTWQATAAAVLDVNAIPVLVDIDPDTYTIDPAAIEAAVTYRTRCIIPVHLYGRMADMDAITAIAKRYNLRVIEDTSHQHGSVWGDKKAGAIGNIGSFSLQASKILNTGEGGMLTTNDGKLADLLQSMKICGRPIREGAPTIQSGNYRMTEFQAAIGIVQLSRLDEQNEVREDNVKYMESILSKMDGIKPLYRSPNITKQSYYCWTLKYDSKAWEGVPRKKFAEAFSAEFSNSLSCFGTYEPLNNSSLYQPHNKNTHRLSGEYWKAINPRRFDLPVCTRAFVEEALLFGQNTLLTGRDGCDMIIAAFEKLRNNTGELVEYSLK